MDCGNQGTWILWGGTLAGVSWRWEWRAFWPELVAGVITLAIGIPIAYALLRYELRLARREEFEQFQNLAVQVRDDLAAAEEQLMVWGDQVALRHRIGPVDAMAWDVDEGELKFVFARRGVARATQLAVSHYREAVRRARKWNEELDAGSLSEDTQRRAAAGIESALAAVRDARSRLEKAARLEGHKGARHWMGGLWNRARGKGESDRVRRVG